MSKDSMVWSISILFFCTMSPFMVSCATMDPEATGPRFASLFTDNMVLQRDVPVPVWGAAAPGETVTVTFRDQRKTAKADDTGRWTLSLDPLKASAEPTSLGLSSSLDPRPSTLENLLVGDVWLASGQSNMEMRLRKCEDGEAEVAKADHPGIRFFDVKKRSCAEPQSDCEGRWEPVSPATAGECFGVSYYFGRDLHGTQKVPIGLINAAWSGACAESFIPLASMRAEPHMRARVAEREQYRKDYPKLRAACEEALAAGKRARRPKDPDGPEMSVGGLYNGMVHPVVPFAIRGVIWYQGENNVLDTKAYRHIFPFLIREWRRLWKAEAAAMSFLYVQVANFGEKQEQPQDNLWTRLRDAQLAGLEEPNTAMVTAIDLGGAFHPKNKKDVGLRLALAARATVYGETDLVWCGPVARSVEFTHTEALVTFDHVGSGLMFKGGNASEGFALAGPDRKFVWADAAIDGNMVRVATSRLVKPVAVRYGWGTNPLGNLYNKEGLPAFPFRSDTWERLKNDR